MSIKCSIGNNIKKKLYRLPRAAFLKLKQNREKNQ
jgi:hypothetical protein